MFGADLRALMELLRAKGIFILLFTGTALALGAAYIVYTPKIYRASAVIQVDQEQQSVIAMDGMKPEDLKEQEVLKTVEQNVTTPELLLRVVDRYKLLDNPEFLPELKRPASRDKIQETFSGHISARIRTGTRLIDVKVEARSRAMAQMMTQLLVDEFIRQGYQSRLDASEMAHDYLARQAEIQKAKLEKSEQALQAYREQTQTVSFEDKQNIVVEKLLALNRRVTEAHAERLKLESDYGQLKPRLNQDPEELLAIPAIATAAPVQALQQSINEKEAQIATLKQRYKALHPKYIAAVSEMRELRNSLNSAILKVATSVEQSYEAAVDTEAKLESASQDQQRLAMELSKMMIAYKSLSSAVESDSALYNSILKRLSETTVNKDIGAIRLISGPILPDHPVKPRQAVILFISLLGGLGCGFGFAAVSRALEDPPISIAVSGRQLPILSTAEYSHGPAGIPLPGQAETTTSARKATLNK